jgi:hypothetical protein
MWLEAPIAKLMLEHQCMYFVLNHSLPFEPTRTNPDYHALHVLYFFFLKQGKSFAFPLIKKGVPG